MSFVIKPIPDPAHVPELKLLLDHKDDEKFVTMLLESLKKANDQARNDGLDPAIYDALLARISHHPPAADADKLAVAGRTPASRLNVV